MFSLVSLGLYGNLPVLKSYEIWDIGLTSSTVALLNRPPADVQEDAEEKSIS